MALIVAWVLTGALLYLPTSAWGQIQEQRLKSFGFASQSGGMPNSLVLGADGALYGTTTGGGSNSVGTIFRLNPDGTGYVQLHSFGGDATDGSVPTGLIQGIDGSLFGTTSEGGDLNGGTVFRLNTNGASYRVLYSFGGDPDGSQPQGLLQAADGWLYGTCKSGGSTWNGKGTVFKLAATGAGFSIIWEFVNPAVEGANPEGALVQGRDGALYGTTCYGGANSVGTVFKLSTNGATQSVLHSFSSAGADGCYPVAGLVQGQDGALYGTASQGGTNDHGIVFAYQLQQFLRRYAITVIHLSRLMQNSLSVFLKSIC